MYIQVEQSWRQAVEPSQQSLDAEAETMLSGMRATTRLRQQVHAVMQVEAAFAKPQPHESLAHMLRPPPPGQQPTMLLQTGTGNGIEALGVPAPDFEHFEAAGRGQVYTGQLLLPYIVIWCVVWCVVWVLCLHFGIGSARARLSAL